MSKEKRNRSYDPGFSGSRTQTQAEFDLIHNRWIDGLKEHLPGGVPLEIPVWRCRRCHVATDRHAEISPGCGEPEPYLDTPRWPATFGTYDQDNEQMKHTPGYRGNCAQCGSCQYYVPLEGDLGMDWGACTNPRSEYDRACVFEHWTCKAFRH